MARMHEILGVEPGEVFEFEDRGERVKYRIDTTGNLYRETMDHRRIPSPREVVEIINNTDHIIRKPRLTEKQIELLKALLLFSFHYLAADMNNSLFAYGDLPERSQFCWYCSFNVLIVGEAKKELLPLAPWDATKPLDIIQTLKDNNVEV